MLSSKFGYSIKTRAAPAAYRTTINRRLALVSGTRTLIDERSLERERRTLERSARLSCAHWLVLALSLAMTLFVWHLSVKATEGRAERRFEREADQIVELFRERLDRYADLLRTSAGVTVASEDATPAKWHALVASIDLRQRYPAITALGQMVAVPPASREAFVARERERWPAFPAPEARTQRSSYYPVVLVSPAHLEAKVIGFDIASEPRRARAATDAMTLKAVRITAPIRPTWREAPGFQMFAPFEHMRATLGQPRDHGQTSSGAIVATVLFEDLLAGVLSSDKRSLRVRLSDAGETLHDEWQEGDGAAPSNARTTDVAFFGRTWRFEIASTSDFHNDTTIALPTFVLGGGLTIDSLLLALFVLLARSNRHALGFAARSGERLRAANRELEAFAYTVSHDLKGPLLNIDQLAGFIDEDLEEHNDIDGELRSRLLDHTGHIQRQAGHARLLVDDILGYSRLESGSERVEGTDVRALLERIGETLGLRDDQLVLAGDFPVLRTCAARLEQVLSNLVGNALAHHHDAPNARVLVRANVTGERCRFSVEDNGPGIEPGSEGRIFDLFYTRGRKSDGTDGTGIGLATVKKNVELMGGAIEVSSSCGQGTTFTFDWPARLPDEPLERVGNDDHLGQAA